MGIFSQNYTSSHIDVVANESYVGTAGAYRAMCEGYQNSYAIFESCIGLDFMEAAVFNEGVDEMEFMVVQENFVTDFFTKIKEFLLKLLEKIKGIIKSFITRVVGTFTSDGKTLVNKYKTDILKKDLSKMKYKYAKPTEKEIKIGVGAQEFERELDDIFDCIGHISATNKRGTDLTTAKSGRTTRLGAMSTYAKDDTDKSGNYNYTKNGSTSAIDINNTELDKINEKLEDSTYLEQALGKAIESGPVEMADFAKEAKEYLFEDEEKFEEDAGNLTTEIMLVLQTAKKQQDELKKDERASEKLIGDMIREIERTNKEVSKLLPNENKNISKNATLINKILNTAQKAEGQLSTYMTKCYAVKLELMKFHFAQCKRIWVQMAAYRPKSVKEDVDLIEAIGEAAEYEAYSSFTEAEMTRY